MAKLAPEPGKKYYSPINAIGSKFPNIDVTDLGVSISSHSIKEQEGEVWPILGLVSTSADHSWKKLYVKMEWLITGLAIGTFTNCWLSDYIYDEGGNQVWRKPGTLRMITEKEGDPLVDEDTPTNLMPLMVNLWFWVATSYSRVFLYHYIGLLLLRTPLVAYELNADILLNFFKIAELVTATRTSKKPTLRSITETSKALDLPYEDSEVKEFWKIRSRDAAHDYRQAKAITRETAVECKLWAEQMVIKDFMDRGESIVRPKKTASDAYPSD